MAADSPTTLTPEERNALADRLAKHSQAITNAARHDVMNDLLLAASALRSMATQDRTLRREIARVAAACPDKATGARLLEIIGVDGGL
jgi:hypothetical protein